MRILATLLEGRRGHARASRASTSTRDAAALRAKIGLAGQYAAVDENLTGFENLEMVGQLYHMPAQGRARRAPTSCSSASTSPRPPSGPAKTYSGGMRRRLDLAAALVFRPPVLFLDEPTTGLDPRSRLALWETIEGRVAQGTTVLLTTQYLDEADRLADQIVVIDHGKVIAEGTVGRAQGARSAASGSTCVLEDAADAERAVAALSEMCVERPTVEGRTVSAPVRRHTRHDRRGGAPARRRRDRDRRHQPCTGRRSTTCSSRSPATRPRSSRANELPIIEEVRRMSSSP